MSRDDVPLQPLRRQRSTEQALAELVPWSREIPARGESRRWRCLDGRWVALQLGQDEDLGRVVVIDSSGRRELCDDVEAAVALATTWQTW